MIFFSSSHEIILKAIEAFVFAMSHLKRIIIDDGFTVQYRLLEFDEDEEKNVCDIKMKDAEEHFQVIRAVRNSMVEAVIAMKNKPFSHFVLQYVMNAVAAILGKTVKELSLIHTAEEIAGFD